jgi:hypothetical protein
MLHHRHKQRLLTTIVSLIVLSVAVDVFIFLMPILPLEVCLLYSFTVAIGLVTAYQCYNYRHSHEHLTLVNTLTQIFLGTILFVASIIILVLYALTGMDIINALLILSVIVVIITFLFLKRFDEFLEREVQGKFPMGVAPSPHHGSSPHTAPSHAASSHHRIAAAIPPSRENPVKHMTFTHKPAQHAPSHASKKHR